MNKKIILKSLLILTGTIILFAPPKTNAQTDNWKAPKIANKLKNPLKGNFAMVKKGKELFEINCVTCHGEKGLGNGVAASGLVPKPANLTSKKVQEQSDGAIYYKITKGKNAMLSWKYSLTSKQRWQLVNYIREFGKKHKKESEKKHKKESKKKHKKESEKKHKK